MDGADPAGLARGLPPPLALGLRPWGVLRRASRDAVLVLPLAGPLVAPLVYLAYLAMSSGWGAFAGALGHAGVPGLLWRVLWLGAVTTVWSMTLAVPMAWLVVRTDMPGRRVFRWLAALPLAVPPYVGAIAYLVLFAPGEKLHRGIATLLDRPTTEVPFPAVIYSPWGAAFVLGLFTYPYIYLVVQAALQRTDPRLEHAAQSLGSSGVSTFFRVTLPLLRPGLTGGALLVFMYALVDFGVVSLLRVRTFTTVVYNYLLAGFSLEAAATLSLVLVTLICATLLAQRRSLGQARYSQATGGFHSQPPVALGRAKGVAVAYAVAVLALALFIPLGVLVWKASEFGSAARFFSFWGEQKGFLWNTVQVALVGSGIALGIATTATWAWRRRPWRWAASGALQAGYAVPGTVLGLTLVGFFLDIAPWVYGTLTAVSLAYVVLFTAPLYQGVQAAMAQVHPSMEEAARGLGHRPHAVFLWIVAPLLRPGILAAWASAFILAARELAATLILRPAGSDTLAVRIWVHTMDVGPDPRAAAAALLLVGLIAVFWLLVLRLIAPDAARVGGPGH